MASISMMRVVGTEDLAAMRRELDAVWERVRRAERARKEGQAEETHWRKVSVSRVQGPETSAVVSFPKPSPQAAPVPVITPCPTFTVTDAPTPTPAGRPKRLTAEREAKLLALLRQGHTLKETARQLACAESTIRRELRLCDRLASEVLAAQVEGREFRTAYLALFTPGRVVLEQGPVIDSPQFEEQKQFLISKGLSREWISRMRLRSPHEWQALLNPPRQIDLDQQRQRVEEIEEEGRKLFADKDLPQEKLSRSGRRRTVTTKLPTSSDEKRKSQGPSYRLPSLKAWESLLEKLSEPLPEGADPHLSRIDEIALIMNQSCR